MADRARTFTLGLIGGGFMGEAIVDGLVKAGVARLDELCIGEALPDRRRQLAQSHAGLCLSDDAAAIVPDCDALLLAVKPQDFHKVAATIKPALEPDQLVISIMAGVRTGTLTDALGHERVVRVMPNTPASLGAGFSGWMATQDVTAAQRLLVRRVLGALGREAEVHEERYLDMVTAVSGSGPAYVFLFIEAMINAAVHIGLPRNLAREMVVQTVLGSVTMAMDSDQHTALLRDAVTSPGGTTAEALHVFERAGLRGIVTEAVIAAHEKSRTLGG